MENTAIQQIHTTPTKNKHLRIYKEERNQELSYTAIVSATVRTVSTAIETKYIS